MAKKILKLQGQQRGKQFLGNGDENLSSGRDSESQESSNQTSPNQITPFAVIIHSPARPGLQNSVCESQYDSQAPARESDFRHSVQIQAELEESNNPHLTRLRKPRNNNSNNSFKKACGPLKKLIKKHLKIKKNDYEKLYHKKSYFILSLLLLQKNFALSTQKFSQILDEYIKLIKQLELKEDGQTNISKQYLEYFEIGIKTFRSYQEGRILQSIKTFYKFYSMKQKRNLQKAIQQYEQERKKFQMQDLKLIEQYKSQESHSQNQSQNSNKQELVEQLYFIPNQYSFQSQTNLFERTLEESEQFISQQDSNLYNVLNLEGKSQVQSEQQLNLFEDF